MHGIISHVNIESKIIGISFKKRIVFFYFPNRLMRLFKKYLYAGNYISLVYEEDKLELHGKLYAYTISYIMKLSVPGRYGFDVFYDKKSINESIGYFLNSLDVALFIDFEMTMPGFKNDDKKFVSEIIQAAYVLVKDDEIIAEKKFDIKPTIAKYINTRTKKFLSLENKIINEAVGYRTFYRHLKTVLRKYNPTIVVFGRNDIVCLNASYHINKVPSITKHVRIIDLNNLMKNYYEMKTQPGLFSLYRNFDKGFTDVQAHDALQDAHITYKVFNYFKDDVSKEGLKNLK